MSGKTESEMAGVLVVDKPKGPTSHDVVASLRRLLNIRRVGHCGTLDPLASGILVVCVGRYTRLNRWLTKADKVYEAHIRLGATSVTGDAQGPIEYLEQIAPPDADSVARAVRGFEGGMEQVPHAFSAVKVGGVPSYKRARKGEEVALKSRSVKIHALETLDYEFPRLSVRVHCSSGTYIRTLAEDIGKRLDTGAYLSDLRRLRVGRLGLDEALTLDDIARLQSAGRVSEAFVRPDRALAAMKAIELSPDQLVDFTHGKPIDHQAVGGDVGEECAVFDAAKRLFGIAQWENGALRPFCVLRQPALR